MKKSSILTGSSPAVGRATAYRTDVTDSHIHDKNELLFLVEGSATYTCNTNAVDVTGPSVIIFNSYSIHGGGPQTIGMYDRYVVYFKDALLESGSSLCAQAGFFKKNNLTVIPLNEEQKQIVLSLLSRFESHVDSPDATDHLMLWLLYELSHWQPQQATPSHHSGKSYINQVLQYLVENYQQNITLQVLTDHFYISRAKLVADFKEIVGISVNDYLSLIRLCNAKSFLDSGKSIVQTAALCGYTDSSYFIHKFSQHFGMTPGQYLRLLKGKCRTV